MFLLGTITGLVVFNSEDIQICLFENSSNEANFTARKENFVDKVIFVFSVLNSTEAESAS